MGERGVRERFAGSKTGPLGIDGVEVCGKNMCIFVNGAILEQVSSVAQRIH